MEEKKKQYTRYTINGRRVTREDLDKMFDKTQADFDKIFDTAMGGVDKAMAGVDIAMGGVDKAMSGVDRAMDKTMEGVDKAVSGFDRVIDEVLDRDDDTRTSTDIKLKKYIYRFATIWLSLFLIGFGIYFLAGALKDSDTKPLPPASTSLEEKTTQEKPDAFRKL